ncbi:superoxide dismutase family protein, partial [Clostridium sp. MCC353]|uniref:superoxide dismutase family protein n=1 Tax=Clostridium sp. MCC353 TaxID=2592646 RepID=UPI001C020EC1
HFAHTGEHYNPTNQPHPDHAGDLPPLLGNQGYAWTSFYDKRFTVDQIMGRAVIIHQKADDFTSQPSGNSGEKIACGVIRPADNYWD